MTLRIGIIGLGGIAQKVYLPLLGAAARWHLVGAFSPNQSRARALCDSYRIPCFARIDELAQQCDALFVHSSTESHFAVVSDLLKRGRHVYVDKPLAAALEQAEALLTLAARQQRILMVGFNRRFAPLYQRLKQDMQHVASLRMDKHRSDSVGPQDVRFTLLDDYLHVVDTALWLAGGTLALTGGVVWNNGTGQLLYAEHAFRCGEGLVTTAMHRQAGSQRETVTAVTRGALYRVEEMSRFQWERAGTLGELPVPVWQTILTQRGFTGAVEHFIDCAANQMQIPTYPISCSTLYTILCKCLFSEVTVQAVEAQEPVCPAARSVQGDFVRRNDASGANSTHD
ncbi:Gfo/Idh/MocA family protein [Candidatus Sodalis pierantonius]|uniref:Gfo/Idh/MocA family protein n=1 Tax=Candidatus Sodalis pierantonii TaxID=1486991 RepID=UPI00046CA011|nr:Gfo/Idh/MocA family oxidoreductase [Candidatus Sodalis pierantonius]